MKPSTYAKYVTIIEHDIGPRLGDYHPTAFTTDLVESFKIHLLTERNLSAKTVRDILVVLKMIVAFTRKQIPGEMPEFEIVYPREQKKEMRVLTQEEQERFMKYLMMGFVSFLIPVVADGVVSAVAAVQSILWSFICS